MKASSVGLSSSAYQKLVKAQRFSFYDEFNRGVEDADFWLSGGDAGSFALLSTADFPTVWQLLTGGNIDNDRFIHGLAIYNKYFVIGFDGYTTLTWEARLNFSSIADISAFFGLLAAVITDYGEPLADCAHFFADPAVNANFNCRSYDGGEEQSDSGIALDTDFHKFKIIWTVASVLFYIDDVLVGTHATRIPDMPMTTEFLIRTEGAAVKGMRLDSISGVMS